MRKLIHVLLLDGEYEALVSDLNTGGNGGAMVGFLIGTPPPRPRGAFVSFPFALYFECSLPLLETSESDVEPLCEVWGLCEFLNSGGSLELDA